jgi:hypothetical protein
VPKSYLIFLITIDENSPHDAILASATLIDTVLSYSTLCSSQVLRPCKPHSRSETVVEHIRLFEIDHHTNTSGSWYGMAASTTPVRLRVANSAKEPGCTLQFDHKTRRTVPPVVIAQRWRSQNNASRTRPELDRPSI